MKTYVHSGIVPLPGALMTLAAGSLAAIFLGIVCAFTFYYIPYVYLNLLFVLAFGLGVGFAVGFTAREGKIRNELVVGCLAVAAALVGIYAEWGSTGYAMLPGALLAQIWRQAGLATFLPQNIVALMGELFENGSWGLTQGTTVRGWPLVVLWLIESGIVIAVAIGTAVQQIANRPFCEKCQEWIAGRTPHLYTGTGSEPVWTEVQHGTYENLAMTPRAVGDEPTFVRLTLRACQTCEDSNYLTVTACQNTKDDKGNAKLVETNLVVNLLLPRAQVEIIEAAGAIAPAAGSPTPEQIAQAANWTLQEPGTA